jgi:hypothetical protein
MKNSNCSIIVQGKLKKDTYNFYKKIYKDVEVLFSTWDEKSIDFANDDESVVRMKQPIKFSLYSRDLELKVVSTLAGLEPVKSEYVMVVRGDEWFSNLDHVFSLMEKSPEKIFGVPVFFRSWDACPFHFSTHMIAGRRENVKLMFDRCVINMVVARVLYEERRPLPDASILAKGYMDAVLGGSENWKEDFRRLFGIVDLERLKYYKVASDDSGRQWYSNFDPHGDGSWERSIKSMEEL